MQTARSASATPPQSSAREERADMPALSSVRRASTALMSSQSRRSTANSPQRKLETYSVVMYEGPMGLKLIPNPGILRDNEVGDISAVVERAIRQGKSVYCVDHSTVQLNCHKTVSITTRLIPAQHSKSGTLLAKDTTWRSGVPCEWRTITG